MTEKQKIDWMKVVQESGGSRIFLPAEFQKEQEAMEKERVAFNKVAVDMAEREIKMNVANQNFFLKVRSNLAKNGYPDIWVKEIGFDTLALKEGKFVINISEPGR